MELSQGSTLRELPYRWGYVVSLGLLFGIVGSLGGCAFGAIPTMLLFRISLDQGWGHSLDMGTVGALVSMGMGGLLICRWLMPKANQDSVLKRLSAALLAVLPAAIVTMVMISFDLTRFRMVGFLIGMSVLVPVVFLYAWIAPRRIRRGEEKTLTPSLSHEWEREGGLG